eukprot:6882710-Prymnesium_polylepis.1
MRIAVPHSRIEVPVLLSSCLTTSTRVRSRSASGGGVRMRGDAGSIIASQGGLKIMIVPTRKGSKWRSAVHV